MKRLGLIALVALPAAGLSCGPAPNLLPVNDLNRPTDVAFMCFGAFPAGGADAGATGGSGGGQLQVSGRPLRACHPQDQFDPGPTTTTRTFAFMPNSASGTLTAVDADHWKLVDLDPDTAGYGTVPLGQDPEQISVSDDGCRLISANRGSCDLTVVDPSILVSPTLSNENGGQVQAPPAPTAPSQTFRPIKEDGTPLLAAPYEAVFLPQDTSALLGTPASTTLPILPPQNVLCGETPTVDPANWPPTPKSTPKSWYALVTYPSCDLVVMVALPSGKIIDSAKVKRVPNATMFGDSVTLEEAGTNPSCPPSSCAGQVLPAATAAAGIDAAASDGAPTVAAPASDAAAADMSGASGGSAGAGTSGSGGTAGAGGAAGAAGTTGAAGATGGAPGTMLGNQYPNKSEVGSPIGPSGIALRPDVSRAYISLANASYVLSVGLSSSGLQLPANVIYLNEGARGATRVRLSVDPTREVTTGVQGVFVGAGPGTHTEETTGAAPSTNFHGLDSKREYLYAIARDGTLRVISVFQPDQPGGETECETNADPLNPNLAAAGFSANTQCIRVDPSYRRPFSIGPGIHFPSLPIDVAAADIQRYPEDTTEQSLNGAHAWVITDSGIVYLVNINPILRDYTAVIPNPKNPNAAIQGDYVSASNVTEPPPFVNTLRDKNQNSYSVLLDSLTGPPRVDVLPSIPPTGPYVEPFWTQGSFLNATALNGDYLQTIAFFPTGPTTPNSTTDPTDRRAITPQTWTIAWEGPLGGQRNTGNMLPAGGDLPSEFPGPTAGLFDTQSDAVFEDGGANYCALGVSPGDLVTLAGCTDSSQCGLGETCLLGNTASTGAAGLAVTGLCVDPNQSERKQGQCAEFLNSVRRYHVESATEGALVVRPNLDEIVVSPLAPECQPASSADGGTPDGGVDAGDAGTVTDSCPDANDPTTARFTCESSFPDGVTGGRRCLMLCKTDGDCRAGRTCIDFDDHENADQPTVPTGGKTGNPCIDDSRRCFCADAPVFDSVGKDCFDQLISYQVSAGKTFVVVGSQSGIVTTQRLPQSPKETCADAAALGPPPDPRFSFRIPMNAPTCTNVDPSVATIDSRVQPTAFGDPNALKLVDVATSPPQPFDPCLYLGGPVEGDPLTVPGADGGAVTGPTHVRALFKNGQISFVLANLDRSPTFQSVTSFDVHGGFAPQTVFDPTTIEVSMPARIIIGPVDSQAQVTSGTAPFYNEAPYLFVVDQRRLGLSQGGGPTRGQLLRINPFSYNVAIGVSASSYLPIFEDYNASGGLFPIQ